MRIVFAGTPEFAVPSLRAVLDRGEVVAVYTQPDRPAGRGMKLQASPVKALALERGIAVSQPRSLRLDGKYPEDAMAARVAIDAAQADVMVVAAYGLILPRAVLDAPRHGCLNVHASLLPRWRGAAPIQRAILADDSMTGVTIMRMEAGLDTGPVMLRSETPIGAHETAGGLEARLADLGASLVVSALDALAEGRAAFEPQDESRATYARKLTKGEARLDWREPAALLARRVRAFQPWPVAEAALDGRQLRIHEAEAVPETAGAAPGTIVRAGAEGIVVAAGSGALVLRRVQQPGRRVVAASDLAGSRGLAGRVLA